MGDGVTKISHQSLQGCSEPGMSNGKWRHRERERERERERYIYIYKYKMKVQKVIGVTQGSIGFIYGSWIRV